MRFCSHGEEADMKMIVHIADVPSCPMELKKKHNILATYLFAKALVPSKSKFLPVLYALTVCDTTSFTAGHEIAKILNIDFCHFFLMKRSIVETIN